MVQKRKSAKVAAPNKRMAKRDKILAIGATTINDLGAGAVRLSDISNELGLSRNALYYYIKDRADLVYQCYSQSCDLILQDLEDAMTASPNASGQITYFVQKTINPHRRPRAIVSDHDMFEAPLRAQLTEKLSDCVNALADIIRTGQNLGEIRKCDARIAAHMLLGMLNWSSLWYEWVSESEAEKHANLTRAAHVISDVYLNGMSAKPGTRFQCSETFHVLGAGTYNAFDREESNAQKRLQLIDTAALFFNRRGLYGTSMDDVGGYLGATKGTIYHYFSDKTDLINACYDRAFDYYELFPEIASSSDLNGVSKLLTTFHLNCQAQLSGTPPLILHPGLNALPEDFLRRARGISARLQDIRNLGLNDGSLRDVDATIMEVSSGAFFWIQKWLPQLPDVDHSFVADQMSNVFMNGIKQI